MAEGLKISGKTGKFTLVNGLYEPMQTQHNGMQCWTTRAVQPCYIFHTGKARWVISKRIDDGSRCYCFIKDGGNKDPTKGDGDWCCPSSDNEWAADPNIHCSAAPASNDKFVQLRMSVEAEMTTYGLVSMSDLKSMWKRLDFNGNNVVSLAEIDKMVVDLVKGGVWPAWLNNKPALMRAYKKTILKDGDGDSWVEKKEFHALLLNIFWFNKLWRVFDEIDSGNDRRMDANEFYRGLSQLGLSLSQQEAMEEFQKIDGNHGGQVLFVEFCAYVRHRVNPDDNPAFDADIASGEKCSTHMRKAAGHKATHTHFVKQKTFKDFDDLEKEIKGIIADNKKLRDLWHHLDFNGNNIVSLAEIDKFAVEQYPLLNHKPALMRAYKASMGAVKADDWVEKKEFKILLANLFYFNKLFWLFDNVSGDHDRRMDFNEFKKCMAVGGTEMSEAEARQEFNKVDVNGGGKVLFAEFCKYFTEQKCPESMTALLD